MNSQDLSKIYLTSVFLFVTFNISKNSVTPYKLRVTPWLNQK